MLRNWFEKYFQTLSLKRLSEFDNHKTLKIEHLKVKRNQFIKGWSLKALKEAVD